jgi:peptidoglycan/xylan/chitin deacetylase (PgdA/CDA1 family)
MSAKPREASLAVLMFHSISADAGPTCIPEETFRMQLAGLAEEGFRSLDCAQFLSWREGRLDATKRVLITFDDGYADFATAAFPALRARGFSAIVFLPTGKVGGREDWAGGNAEGRPLMDWPTVAELARSSVEFGGHGVTHTDVTRLAPERRRAEIEQSARILADRVGERPRSFAAPYGRVDAEVIADISRTYDAAFGTRFAHATRDAPRFDVPRIEMHYFRDARRWRGFLQGRSAYFLARRTMRAVRERGLAALRVLD